MHIHILSLLKVIVILYSIRQTQINQNLHIIQIIYMDTWIFHTDNQTLEPTLISHFSLFWPLGTECLATLLCFNSLGWVSNSMPHSPKLLRGSTLNNECQIGNKWSITGLELVNLSTLTLIGLVITVLSSSISMKWRGGVQQKKFHFHWPLFSMKVEICKNRKGYEYMKLWHLCLTPTHLWYMSQFLLQKKLCFETGTHPPFGPMSQNTQFFFFEGFPNSSWPFVNFGCL